MNKDPIRGISPSMLRNLLILQNFVWEYIFPNGHGGRIGSTLGCSRMGDSKIWNQFSIGNKTTYFSLHVLTSIFLQKPNLQQQLECVLKLGHGGDTSTKFEIEVYMEFLNDLSLDKHARVVKSLDVKHKNKLSQWKPIL